MSPVEIPTVALVEQLDRLSKKLVRADQLLVAFRQAIQFECFVGSYAVADKYQARTKQLARRIIEVEQELARRKVKS